MVMNVVPNTDKLKMLKLKFKNHPLGVYFMGKKYLVLEITVSLKSRL